MLAVVAGASVTLGFAIGNWSACIQVDCKFDAGIFEAVGTWVGGFATALAVAVAARQLSIQLKQDREQRDAAEVGLREAATSAVSDAIGIRVELQPYVELARGVREIRTTVFNDTSEPIGNLRMRLGDLPEQTGHALAPGYQWESIFGVQPGAKVGKTQIPSRTSLDRHELALLKQRLTSEVEFLFEMRGHRIRRPGDDVPRLADERRGY